MKDTICTVIGLIGGAIAALFGGWDTALQTLVIFMAIDYITGLVVAGVFHASPKTKTGALESKAGWKGLIRKGETLLIVLVACQLDAVIGGSFVRDAEAHFRAGIVDLYAELVDGNGFCHWNASSRFSKHTAPSLNTMAMRTVWSNTARSAARPASTRP